MGMDLKPRNPTADAPKDAEYGGHVWGRYNWSGWTYITNKLAEWGVPLDEFSGLNDGDIISAETCCKVADAIDAHLHELDDRDRAWLGPHALLWRTCGGYEQL
jgi:hypothetical protein